MKKVDPAYQKKIEDVKVEGEKYAEDAMKGVYLEQKAALDELHALIGKAYIDHSKDGIMTLTTTQQQQLTASMNAKLKATGLKLGKSEVEKVTSLLAEVFSATYYKNAFVMESGLKANLKFNIIKPEFIQAAVNTEFKGEMFSDRIWKNKAGLIDSIQSSLVDAYKGKKTIDKIGREIRQRFEVTAYESQRLVSNENARVQSQAIDEIGRSAGVEQQMYLATLDGKTSAECAALDGKVWGIDDPEKVTPPEVHVGCRCVLCNVPYSGWQATQRRDNETGKVIPNQTYAEWTKDKGV